MNKFQKIYESFINEQQIKTLEDFLNITKYNRDKNYPSIAELKNKIKELKINDDELEADILGYLLYDNKSK